MNVYYCNNCKVGFHESDLETIEIVPARITLFGESEPEETEDVCPICHDGDYLSNEATPCYHCGIIVHNEDIWAYDGNPHCKSCWEKMPRRTNVMQSLIDGIVRIKGGMDENMPKM